MSLRSSCSTTSDLFASSLFSPDDHHHLRPRLSVDARRIHLAMASALRKALPASVREIRYVPAPALSPPRTIGSCLPLLSARRLHFCQTSPASKGARDFVSQSYEPIKKANSSLPILIREAQGVPARAFIRFGA